MAKKFRNAQSYYGNTAEARKRQRANLIPGNTWQKRRTKELRLDCFWEDLNLRDKRFIYEYFVNYRSLKDTPKKELKDKKFLDTWWNNKIDIETKKQTYKEVMSWQTPKFRAESLDRIIECIKKKSAVLYRD